MQTIRAMTSGIFLEKNILLSYLPYHSIGKMRSISNKVEKVENIYYFVLIFLRFSSMLFSKR